MQLITVLKTKCRLSQLIKRALVAEEVSSATAGAAMDRPAPMQPDLVPRQGGQLKGIIWIAGDFDEFDEELEEMYYGGKE